MQLGNKILKLRKKKGLSQEELGEKVDVTRQTISNWELGETQPNPEQLKKLSKELNVSIDELLDNDIQNVLVEKVSNTEKLAGYILKIIKISIGFLISAFVLLISVSLILRIVRSKQDTGREIEENIHCTLYGEEHSYSITYEEYTGRPIGSGGDPYFYDILDLDKYNDANQIFNVINDYVKKNGGTCTRFVGRELNDIINMYIKEGTLTNTGATIVIENEYDYNILFGESYYIEKYNYNSNKFEELENQSKCVVNDIGYALSKGQTKEMNYDWSHCLGKLEKGTYRFVKDISFDSDSPIEENNVYYIWTEFTID